MKYLIVLVALTALAGCNEIAVPPTSPTVVTPPVQTPPLVIPDRPPVELSLSTGSGDVRVGEGTSLRAVTIKGELFAPAVYAWTFGDGQSETTETSFAGHVYQQGGEYSASVQVRDRNGTTADASAVIVVTRRPSPPRDPPPPPPTNCPTITLSPSTLPNGTVGVNYNRKLTASGGKAPYDFYLFSGTLPAGLLLAATGVVSGSPTTAETATAVVYASDVNGCPGSRSYTITIAAAPPPPGVLTAVMSCTAEDNLNIYRAACNISGTYEGQPVPSSQITKVDWDWGDGTTSTSTSPARTHLFPQAGNYTVIGVMTATTADGAKTATASATVRVPRTTP